MNSVQQIQRYAKHRDAEAFAALVRDYQSMVLATCRRRVHRPADVDDAVQETFLKLAKHADSLRSNVAAWLHRCASNVSSDVNRRAEARRRHEAGAAVGESMADAQQELIDLREQLDAALNKLDEPARELILQRYFVGRSQSDIAAEAGVSASAISQRLDRAIESLRVHLNTSGAKALALGSVAALAELLSAESTSASVAPGLTAELNAIGLSGAPAIGAGTAGAFSAAVVAMIAVAVLSIVIVAAALLPAIFGTGSTPVVAANPTSAPAISGITVTDVGLAPPAAPNWQPPARVADGVFVGQVTDEKGRPIPNAIITLVGNTAAAEPSVRTDAEGVYQFTRLNAAGNYRVSVEADGYVAIQAYGQDRDLQVRLTPDAQVQRTWVLQRAVPVRVTLIDVTKDGMPESPTVDAFAPAAGTLERPQRVSSRRVKDDVYAFDLRPSPLPYTIVVLSQYCAPSSTTVTAKSPDEPVNVELAVGDGIEVKGVAVCSDGKPPAGWTLHAQPSGHTAFNVGYYPIPIAADGSFTLPHVVPGRNEVSFSIPSAHGQSSSSPLGQFDLSEHRPLKLNLPVPSPASMVVAEGRVRWTGDLARDPGAQVIFVGRGVAGQYRSTSLPLKPDAQGEQAYTIDGLLPGAYHVQFTGQGMATVVFENVAIPGPLPTPELRIAGAGKLVGAVTDAGTGDRISSFAFRVRKIATIGDGPNYQPSMDWVQVGDASGGFEVETVGPGIYQVQVSADGYAWTWSESVRVETNGEAASVRIALRCGGSIHGVVRDLAGKPVPHAKVVPLSKAGSPVVEHLTPSTRFLDEAGAALTDAQGHYVLDHLVAGSETLRVVHPDFAPQRVEGVTVTDGVASDAQTIVLRPGGTAQGTVYDADGKRASGVTIVFQDEHAYNGDEMAGRVARTTTDGQGRYRVEHLPDQPLWVSLVDRWTRPGICRRMMHPIDGVTTTLDFGGTISTVVGRIMDGPAQPAASAKLSLSSGDRYFGGEFANVIADPAGRFQIQGVAPGRYVLYREMGTDQKVPLRDVLVASSSTPVDLGDVVDERGTITIKLEPEDPADAEAINGVGLSLDGERAGWEVPVDRFERKGDAWVADGVAAGRWIARAYAPGDGPAGNVVVERKVGDGPLTYTLKLPKRSATLRLDVSDEATTQPARGVIIVDEGGNVFGADGKLAERHVPPGKYWLSDWRQRRDPRSPPLEVQAGQTLVLPPVALSPSPTLSVRVWAADGTLATLPRVTLTDAQGRPVPAAAALGAETTNFDVAAGRYTARVEGDGRVSVERVIDVPSDTAFPHIHTKHIVLPD